MLFMQIWSAVTAALTPIFEYKRHDRVPRVRSGQERITCKSFSKIVTIYQRLDNYQTLLQQVNSALRGLNCGIFISALVLRYIDDTEDIGIRNISLSFWQARLGFLSRLRESDPVRDVLAQLPHYLSQVILVELEIELFSQLLDLTWWVFAKLEIWLLIFESILPASCPIELSMAALAWRHDYN